MRGLVVLSLLIGALPAAADEVLYSEKAWTVTRIDGAPPFCRTSATNESGTTLSLDATADGETELALSDPDWVFDVPGEDTQFGIRINAFDLMTFDAVKSGSRISSALSPILDEYGALIEGMSNGTALSVESQKGTPVTRFSLDGAAAALEAQFACEDAL